MRGSSLGLDGFFIACILLRGRRRGGGRRGFDAVLWAVSLCVEWPQSATLTRRMWREAHTRAEMHL